MPTKASHYKRRFAVGCYTLLHNEVVIDSSCQNVQQAHEAVEEAEAKAAAAEKKAKAAAPSKRKREAAVLAAQHAALVSVADSLPQVAAVLRQQEQEQAANRPAPVAPMAAHAGDGAAPAAATEGAAEAPGGGAAAPAAAIAGASGSPAAAAQQQASPQQPPAALPGLAGGRLPLQSTKVSSPVRQAPQHQQQELQQQHAQQQQAQQAQQQQQQQRQAMQQLAAGLPSMPMFNPAIPATAQFPLGGAPPFGLPPGAGGVWAQILASLPPVSLGLNLPCPPRGLCSCIHARCRLVLARACILADLYHVCSAPVAVNTRG